MARASSGVGFCDVAAADEADVEGHKEFLVVSFKILSKKEE